MISLIAACPFEGISCSSPNIVQLISRDINQSWNTWDAASSTKLNDHGIVDSLIKCVFTAHFQGDFGVAYIESKEIDSF